MQSASHSGSLIAAELAAVATVRQAASFQRAEGAAAAARASSRAVSALGLSTIVFIAVEIEKYFKRRNA